VLLRICISLETEFEGERFISFVCAIVVTFHPDALVMQGLAAVRPQVEKLIVVDNGSTREELLPLREASSLLGFELIENGNNLGIATALNIGVRRGEALGAEWFLLLDQDGRVTDGYVAAMLRGFAASASGERLAILVPRYVDSRYGNTLTSPPADGAQLEVAVTSGSLTPLRVFRKAGYFADELFIDQVDSEYSLRVRALGYAIEECTDAVLLHSPGTPTYHRVLGSKPFQVANYGPVRRYYQARNLVWLVRRYGGTFRPFVRSQVTIHAKDFVKICFEENRWEKWRFFLWGLADGLRGRMGAMAR
jgi:rhamnosyltransferase